MSAVNPVSFRLPSDLKAWLQAKAQDEGRSLNRQVVQTLKAAMTAETKECEPACKIDPVTG